MSTEYLHKVSTQANKLPFGNKKFNIHSIYWRFLASADKLTDYTDALTEYGLEPGVL
jgi:hypothetical protein